MSGRRGLVFVSIGFELLGLILGSFYIGHAVDEHFHWPGYGVIFFVVGGMSLWVYRLIILMRRFMEQDEADERKSSEEEKK